ncbi:hypothetical protein E4P42_00415 [Mycobacterium sp. PS03-16]|uniref:hypothetical protein n=1 Tax=Mycobacterium sp. PS03-16 TaxID=2559611 RepID=UPI001073EB3E|nr:hypothetical protein [Mycobacterium sp. PS03-16]TFV61400.1 hypothetical protein E4P42_00415 [Mycobacterium sp. PS03-16]
MDTEAFLTALAGYLAGVGLAQWSAVGDYRDDPALPAIQFAQADVPDTLCVLTVTGRNEALRQWDVAFTFRATGVNPLPVEKLADAVSDHFRIAFDLRSQGQWVGGSIQVMPTVALPGGLTLTEVSQKFRGTAELTSAAKHKGSRFVRSDSYRMTVRG